MINKERSLREENNAKPMPSYHIKIKLSLIKKMNKSEHVYHCVKVQFLSHSQWNKNKINNFLVYYELDE